MVKSAYIYALVLSVFVIGVDKAQSQRIAVNWQSASSADSLIQQEARPILIDVYTNWCYYCKVMDATTWRNDSVVQYVNANYHTIKLNAEDRQSLRWQGKVYPYDTRSKVNRLAYFLLSGRMSFPSTIIVPVVGDPIIIPGAFKPAEGEMTLKYFGARANEAVSFREFQKTFSRKW